MPLPHPAVVPVGGIVVRIHLDVDEANVHARQLSLHVRDHVDDRSAGSARAELRRREGDDERLMRRERGRDRGRVERAVRVRRRRQWRKPSICGRERRSSRSRSARSEGR